MAGFKMDPDVLSDVLTLAAIERPRWPEISARIARSGVPTCEGDPGADAADAATESGKDDGNVEGGDSSGDAGSDPAFDGDKDEWRSFVRKHEKRAKQETARAAKAEAELAKIREANASESEKALNAARAEARAEATAEFQTQRRADQLEIAVTRSATSGVKIGEESVKFADPDDAHTHIERAIARGDLDADDIFDQDGKVQTSALTEALADLLSRKPHLRAGSTPVPAGDADGGKGNGPATDEESLTVGQRLERQQKK